MPQLQESRRTFADYRDTFTFLLGFAERRTGRRPTRLSIADLDAPAIGAFLQHLEAVRGITAATRHVPLAAMRSFSRYEAYGDPDTRRDPAGHERFDRAIVNHLTTTETDARSRPCSQPHARCWTTRVSVRCRPHVPTCAAGTSTPVSWRRCCGWRAQTG
ncbi:hypothetical protein QA943_14660 [Streptomyces sp. B21-097]|uniref:hypothetical protein n=1 Tax=Streptomyces sp. B21-097 TaxID=3039414 RepID=UPI002FF0234B